jgi:hypothetical protein
MFANEHGGHVGGEYPWQMEYLDDILTWPDGSWCFRSELPVGVIRDDYRVIASTALEWRAYQAKRLTQPS